MQNISHSRYVIINFKTYGINKLLEFINRCCVKCFSLLIGSITPTRSSCDMISNIMIIIVELLHLPLLVSFFKLKAIYPVFTSRSGRNISLLRPANCQIQQHAHRRTKSRGSGHFIMQNCARASERSKGKRAFFIFAQIQGSDDPFMC